MIPFKLQTRQFNYLNPYLIAEIGVNHEGDLNLAKRMIEEVARSGGHAAKFQTYKAEKIASPAHSPSYWDLKAEPSTSQFELFKKYDRFNQEDYEALAAHCRLNGIDFMSTPFDLDAVAFLAPLVPAFKIASADITNVPLIKKIAKQKKPIILSTGAATIEEIRAAIAHASDAPSITLLHCVLNYPTAKNRAQMALMNVLQEMFGTTCSIGYSDHVVPEKDGSMPALEIAALRGAVVIEKHFTYDKSQKGNDHYHSMDSNDLLNFSSRLETYRTLTGSRSRNLEWEQQAISHARRRIVAAGPIKKGMRLDENLLVALRSDVGIEISQWETVIGKTAAADIAPGQALEWSHVE